MYSASQTTLYLQRIGFEGEIKYDLATLTKLMQSHLSLIPFENFSIHYSKHHTIDVDPQAVFHKIVERKHGGYCMENNTAFSTLLKSVGFDVYTGGARVAAIQNGGPNGVFLGLSHMVIFVTIEDKKYLVDVGFGGDNIIKPMLLQENEIIQGVGKQKFRLVLQKILYSRDDQKFWILQFTTEDEEWIDCYIFNNTEFFLPDYQVMSFFTSTSPDIFFTQKVVGSIITLDKHFQPIGKNTLYHNVFKIKKNVEIIETFTAKTEKERVELIEKIFHISLNEEEVLAIKGLVSELKE